MMQDETQGETQGEVTEQAQTEARDATVPADAPETVADVAQSARLEAVLFTLGDPTPKKRVAKACDMTEEEVGAAITAYNDAVREHGRGLVIATVEERVQLVTAPATQEVVEQMLSDALSEDLSKAALEVLAIVAYRSPVSRAEVDAIRGVNCSFSLHGLLMRGLIERVPDPEQPRAYLYRVTHDFVTHLGLTSVEELPDYATLTQHAKIDQVKGNS